MSLLRCDCGAACRGRLHRQILLGFPATLTSETRAGAAAPILPRRQQCREAAVVVVVRLLGNRSGQQLGPALPPAPWLPRCNPHSWLVDSGRAHSEDGSARRGPCLGFASGFVVFLYQYFCSVIVLKYIIFYRKCQPLIKGACQEESVQTMQARGIPNMSLSPMLLPVRAIIVGTWP